LKDFSGEVLNTKKDYKEKNIQLLDLLQVSNIKGVKDIQEVILRISTLNRSDIENISSEWEDIINNNDNTLTDFLKELLVYAVVTKGFYWHPLSYKAIASYKTRVAVENYDKIFTDFTAFENNNFERFLTQLLGNLTHRKRLWTEYTGKYD
jgi:superfamily I DNA/RNA helicase